MNIWFDMFNGRSSLQLCLGGQRCSSTLQVFSMRNDKWGWKGSMVSPAGKTSCFPCVLRFYITTGVERSQRNLTKYLWGQPITLRVSKPLRWALRLFFFFLSHDIFLLPCMACCRGNRPNTALASPALPGESTPADMWLTTTCCMTGSGIFSPPPKCQQSRRQQPAAKLWCQGRITGFRTSDYGQLLIIMVNRVMTPPGDVKQKIKLADREDLCMHSSHLFSDQCGVSCYAREDTVHVQKTTMHLKH